MGKTADRERATAVLSRAKAEALAAIDPAEARQHAAVAELAEQHAALCDGLDATRAAYQADPLDAGARAAHKAKQIELHRMRSEHRALGQLAGTRGAVAVVNNTTEG